ATRTSPSRATPMVARSYTVVPSARDGGAGVGPRPAGLDVDVVGQAEHALGDDVALDLPRPAAHGQRLGEEEAGVPVAVAEVGLGLVRAEVGVHLAPALPAGLAVQTVAARDHRPRPDEVPRRGHDVLAVLVSEDLPHAG